MKYSDAFERLYQMSRKIELRTEVNEYNRIAIFIGRVMIAENGNSCIVFHNTPLLTLELFAWIKELWGFKEKIIPHIIQLTDDEWEKIRIIMLNHVDKTMGLPAWRAKRAEWIHSLDTLREFERE